jgi:SAM-dependent methyltransferase
MAASVLHNLENVVKMAVGPVRDRGFRELFRSIRGTLRAVRRERIEAFDAHHGTDTGKTLRWEDLRAIGDDVQSLWRYFPTLRDGFQKVMDDVHIAPEDFVFIDLGSGKGRALLLASELPFKRIVGVELAPSLHDVARRNVTSYRGDEQRCHDFELICGDAADYEFPLDNLFIFLFQPFPEPVLSAVLDHLGRSLAEHPREVVLAYANPVFHRRVLAAPFLHLDSYEIGTEPGEFDRAVYSNRPR